MRVLFNFNGENLVDTDSCADVTIFDALQMMESLGKDYNFESVTLSVNGGTKVKEKNVGVYSVAVMLIDSELVAWENRTYHQARTLLTGYDKSGIKARMYPTPKSKVCKECGGVH
jgi:hypothetical protein